jgi:hypothetical protein
MLHLSLRKTLNRDPMNPNFNSREEAIKVIFGFAAFFFTAVAIILTIEGPLKNPLALLGGVLVFFLYLYLVDSHCLNYRVVFHIRTINKEIILVAYYFFSIIVVLFTSSIQGLYLDNWSLITPLNWLRIVSAFSLVAFLPGFAVSKIVDYKREINGTPLTVLSHLVSYFLATFVSFILVVLGIFSTYGTAALLLFNLAVAVIYSWSFIYRMRNSSITKSKPLETSSPNFLANVHDKLPLLFLIILYSVMLFSVFFTYNSTLKGDMWRNMYGGIVFLKGDFLERWGATYYPWWFSLFLAALSMLSGSPPVNTYLLAVFLNIFTIIAFYAMVSSFFRDGKSKVPLLSTVLWTLFSGFGWIYALYDKSYTQPTAVSSWLGVLLDAGNKTMNNTIYATSFTHGYFTATVGFACLFTLIYLTHSEGSKVWRISLLALVSALAYLVHVAELVFFIAAVLPCFLLIYSKHDDIAKLRRSMLSVLAGLSIAIAIDLSSSFQYYTTSTLLYIYLAALIFLTGLTYLKEKLSFRVFSLAHLRNFLNGAKVQKCLKFFVIPFIWYIYFLSFIIWLKVYPDFNLNASSWLSNVGLVPWYFYPLLFGVSAFLTLSLISYSVYARKDVLKGFVFFLLLIPFTLIIGRFITYANMYLFATDYYERRIASLGLGIALPVLGASAMALIFSKLNSRRVRHIHFRDLYRPAVASCILIVIIIGGSLSTFLTVDFWTSGGWEVYRISDGETAALNYLKSHAPAASLVITATDESNTKLGLAGVTTLIKRWAFFEAKDPETAFSTLAYTSYIYLHNRDVAYLNSQSQMRDGYFMQHLISHLTIAFNNSESVIYSVPSFAPPTNSSFGLVSSSTNLNDRLTYPLEMAALSNLSYNIYLDTDSSRFSSSTLMLPYDPLPQNNSAQIGWIDNSFLTGWYVIGGGLGNGSATRDNGVFDVKPIGNWVAFGKSCDVNVQDYPTLTINYTHENLPGSDSNLHNVYFRVKWIDMAGNQKDTTVLVGLSEIWDAAVLDLRQLLQNPYKVTQVIINPDTNVEAKVASISFSKPANIEWRGDNLKTGWQVVSTFQLSNYSLTTDNGILNMTISSNTNSSNAHALYYAFNNLFLDISKYPFLIQKRLIAHNDNSVLETQVIINGKAYFLGSTSGSGVWETQVIDLRKLVSSGNITEIRLITQLQPGQTSTTVSGYWDYLALSAYPYALDFDSNSFVDYINWVNNGGQLIVLNTNGHGAFSNLLSISEGDTSLVNGLLGKNNISITFPSACFPTSFTSDSSVEVIADYTDNGQAVSPYAYRMKLGKGDIVYLETFPYFESMEKGSWNLERSAYFENLKSLLDVLSLSAPVAEPQPPIRFTVQDEVILSGSAKLTATGVDQNIQDLKITGIDLSNVICIVNGTKLSDLPEPLVLKHIQIIGQSESELSTGTLQLQASGHGGYALATFVGGFNWTLKLSDTAISNLTLSSGESTFNLVAEGGSFTLSAEASSIFTICVKNPQVFNNGSSCFSYAYVDAPYSQEISCYGYPLTINGQVAFGITTSDSGTNAMGSTWLSYKGAINVTLPSGQYWDEWKIPWISVLTSPFHVLLIGGIVVAEGLIYTKERKRTKF